MRLSTIFVCLLLPGFIRATIMDPYLARFPKIVYSAHGPWTPIFYDNANERGGDLMLVTMNGTVGTSSILVSGETRDPDVSYDGKKVVFGWRGGASGTPVYRIFEIDLDTRITRQITSGAVVGDPRHSSDVEPIYLPNGDIMFNSTRMVQMGDCLNDASITANLFLCNKDGKYLRRISYDQAHIAYPSVLSSGEVVYSRWDYNDKNHTYAHALFVMNPDGSRQRQYYGENSWWPTALYYARQIPGTNKVMAIVGGYHTGQSGQVGIIDANQGIANGVGVLLLAPVRLPRDDTQGSWGTALNGLSLTAYIAKWGTTSFDPAVFPKANAYPNDGWTSGPYSWPYPFDENAMLVCESGGLYFMTADGQKQLIVSGPCATPVPVIARNTPPVLASTLDWSKSTAICQIMDINITQDPLLKDIPRGTIKRLRVAALEYRTGPDPGDGAMNVGPGSVNNGGATASCPIARAGASWDVKWIIGETPVESDGSASFYVPARTPVYFQALDEKGAVVQTMRSWATLMPGENNTCMGCHESKLQAVPPLTYTPIALKRGPVPLDSFYGPARGFSFLKEIQPILDAKCVSCHNASLPNGIDLSAGSSSIINRSCSRAYTNLVQSQNDDYRGTYVWWQSAEDSPLLQPPYRTGSCRSPLISLLDSGHNDVVMTKEEMDKIRCWIDLGVPSAGDYTEGYSVANKAATDARIANRRAWEAQEKLNIAEFVRDFPIESALRPGKSAGDLNPSMRILGVWSNPRTGAISLRITVSGGTIAPAGDILISLYSSAGQCLRTMTIEHPGAGIRTIGLDGGNGPLPPGFYLCTATWQGSRQGIALVRSGG
jgi:hypothetical protein